VSTGVGETSEVSPCKIYGTLGQISQCGNHALSNSEFERFLCELSHAAKMCDACLTFQQLVHFYLIRGRLLGGSGDPEANMHHNNKKPPAAKFKAFDVARPNQLFVTVEVCL